METTNFIIDAQAPAKHNIKAEQKLAKTRKGEKYDAVMLKKNLIKGVKKNPTIDMLRAAVRDTTDEPSALWNKYNPCYKQNEEIKALLQSEHI